MSVCLEFGPPSPKRAGLEVTVKVEGNYIGLKD